MNTRTAWRSSARFRASALALEQPANVAAPRISIETGPRLAWVPYVQRALRINATQVCSQVADQLVTPCRVSTPALYPAAP
jgi:hypothetical protein